MSREVRFRLSDVAVSDDKTLVNSSYLNDDGA